MQPQAPNPDQTTELVWDEATAPNYVTTTGPASLEEVTLSLEGGDYETHSDELGRPSMVSANVTPEMTEAGSRRKRDELPDPLGWPKNAEVDIQMADGTYHGWLFNRSHLLAKSLGGPDTADNLVTGTRCQNVGNNDGSGGMGLPETTARDWLRNNPQGSLYYEVEPHYVGSEPIPRTVSVDLRTSDGSVDAHYVTYNCAKGFAIDYATGAWQAA
jgi:DNA-entry nuclease